MTTTETTIVITGASRGIGAALAKAYAGPNIRLALIGRDRQQLSSVANDCAAQGAHVHVIELDVRNHEVLRATLQAFDNSYAVDLAIANAGVTCGRKDETGLEDPEEAHRLTQVNYTAAVETAQAVLPGMKARGHGQIAFVSSLAGLRALPDMPSYSATKAAIASYGAALRGQFRGTGVAVAVIYPGFVASSMTARHLGAKPFKISAEKAARIIKARLHRKWSVIAFPIPLVVGIWLQKTFLIPPLSDLTMGLFRAKILEDPSYRNLDQTNVPELRETEKTD
ncbi:SDR family NAD(P)-dependent oxidoreductase [Pseudovibrio exalbescens]|uniref:SDR family NAD(P)-dependent oxidoreductase n=1 Tax=Pseudovibrio exalbescens TaxID=197461 RepID=UPI002365DC1C|nr:SDR family NAD(P)-dependent oxidoreductase [Pseudovibrio exalbescens]MDD7909034.1 SDR family NAD(P)-dependent oxidoreductase [Pseudovibrio exalbescens]